MKFENVINLKSNQITDPTYIQQCKATLERDGAIVINNFITDQALEQIRFI